jgi:hypothetical protein
VQVRETKCGFAGPNFHRAGHSIFPQATSARDAIAIANIVDSVLADLRPKILEEITKKLAGK